MDVKPFGKKEFLQFLEDALPDEPQFYGFAVEFSCADMDNAHTHIMSGLKELQKEQRIGTCEVISSAWPGTLTINVRA